VSVWVPWAVRRQQLQAWTWGFCHEQPMSFWVSIRGRGTWCLENQRMKKMTWTFPPGE
jgi:hypothetical protein